MSFDDAASHQAFRQKYGLTTPLLLDTDRAIATAYGALTEFKGQTYAARHTFVVGTDGTLCGVIRDVNLDAHADQIIACVTG